MLDLQKNWEANTEDFYILLHTASPILTSYMSAYITFIYNKCIMINFYHFIIIYYNFLEPANIPANLLQLMNQYEHIINRRSHFIHILLGFT